MDKDKDKDKDMRWHYLPMIVRREHAELFCTAREGSRRRDIRPSRIILRVLAFRRDQSIMVNHSNTQQQRDRTRLLVLWKSGMMWFKMKGSMPTLCSGLLIRELEICPTICRQASFSTCIIVFFSPVAPW